MLQIFALTVISAINSTLLNVLPMNFPIWQLPKDKSPAIVSKLCASPSNRCLVFEINIYQRTHNVPSHYKCTTMSMPALIYKLTPQKLINNELIEMNMTNAHLELLKQALTSALQI